MFFESVGLTGRRRRGGRHAEGVARAETSGVSRDRRPYPHARDTRSVLHQIEQEAPVVVVPVDGLALELGTARWLDQQIDNIARQIAEDERHAQELLHRAEHNRRVLRQLKQIRRGELDRPQEDSSREKTVPAKCWSCGQTAETRRRWDEHEGREVPLCPSCFAPKEVEETPPEETPAAPEETSIPEPVEEKTAVPASPSLYPPEPFGPSAVPHLDSQRSSTEVVFTWVGPPKSTPEPGSSVLLRR